MTPLYTVVYATETAPAEYTKALFAAGPTPRGVEAMSWRLELLDELTRQGYDGVVFIPEPRNGVFAHDYDDQIEWETLYLNLADVILFWVPRELQHMPAFTTNVEYGTWLTSGKVVFGAPPEAPKNRYLAFLADTNKVPQASTLAGTVDLALNLLSDGALRVDGERFVPLHIWRTLAFQQWYEAQKAAGNVLLTARLISTFPQYRFNGVFMWSLHVDLWSSVEQRHKDNEVVTSRTPVVSVLAYHPGVTFLDTSIVLVKEFRAPASTPDGYVWELPGGSSFNLDLDPREVAIAEMNEETGILVDADRLRFHGDKQLAPTFSAHRATLYSVELDSNEIEEARSREGMVHGEINPEYEQGERCYLQIVRIRDILHGEIPVDWTTRGMILSLLESW